MAVARRGGGAMAGAVVVLGIGFVVSSILAIVLYTQVNAEAERANQAEAQRSRLMSSQDSRTQEVADRLQTATANATLVGKLFEEVQLYRQLIGGTAMQEAEDLEQKRLAVAASLAEVGAPVDAPLMDTVTSAYARLAEQAQTVANLEAQLRSQNERVARLEEAHAEIQKKYAEAEAMLTERFTSVSGGFERQIQRFDEQRNELENQLRDLQSQMEAETTDLTDQVLAARQQVRSLQERLDDLTERVGGNMSGTDPSLLPDGRLVSDPDAEGLVAINLGRRDRLTLGTTFQVFDNRTGVIRNSQGDLEGKAKIEVVNVFDDSALARVVERKTNAVLTRDDMIANVVYDPNMTLEFHVYGDFVREGTTRPSVDGRRWIESLVGKWGGRLTNEFTTNTDFVVLGVPPVVRPQPEEINIEEWDRWNRERQRAEEFQQVLSRAREMKIPILNQNQFLTMVGYYRR